MTGDQLWLERRHACSCFGLAVHHDEIPAMTTAEATQPLNFRRRQSTAGLGDATKRRRREWIAADPVDEIEAVGHTRQRGDAPTIDKVPKAGIDH